MYLQRKGKKKGSICNAGFITSETDAPNVQNSQV